MFNTWTVARLNMLEAIILTKPSILTIGWQIILTLDVCKVIKDWLISFTSLIDVLWIDILSKFSPLSLHIKFFLQFLLILLINLAYVKESILSNLNNSYWIRIAENLIAKLHYQEKVLYD